MFMAQTKSGVSLADGEQVILELEAELWAVSSNPIAQIMGGIMKTIGKILGYRIKGFLVVTNKRVVEVSETIQCYCFVTNRSIKYVMPTSVKEIGYTRKAVCGCLCPAYHLYYDALTQRTSILLKGADEAAAVKSANAFYSTIAGVNI
jgi:hypothetical protein